MFCASLQGEIKPLLGSKAASRTAWLLFAVLITIYMFMQL